MYTLLSLGLMFLSVPIVFIIIFVVYLMYMHRLYSHIPGPPLESFFFGNLPKIRKFYKKGDYTHILFLEWAKQYGPVYRVFVLHKCMIFLSSPTVIKEVLTHTCYPKASMTYSHLCCVCGERFLGNGLVTMINHKKWHQKRAIINPAFRKRLLSGMMDQFSEVADKWINQLECLADGKTYLNMEEYFGRVTLDVLGKVAFGVDFHALDSTESPFRQALWHILEGYSAQLRDPFLKFRSSKSHLVETVQKAVKIVRSEGQKILANHMLQGSKECAPDNILKFIVKYTEALPDMHEEDLLDEFCTILIAGQETTANMLGFLFKELGDHPEVLQRMLDEINELFGERSHVTYDDINRLEYMGHVIKETLRLYPPAMGTTRESVNHTVLNGYHIPSGTQLVVSFYIVHHMPEYFPDPDMFNPDRFSSDSLRKFFTFMPFSTGQRSCAGQHFAMIEAKVLLCKFLSKFTFELDPDQPAGIQETTTLRPRGGVQMKLFLKDQHTE